MESTSSTAHAEASGEETDPEMPTLIPHTPPKVVAAAEKPRKPTRGLGKQPQRPQWLVREQKAAKAKAAAAKAAAAEPAPAVPAAVAVAAASSPAAADLKEPVAATGGEEAPGLVAQTTAARIADGSAAAAEGSSRSPAVAARPAAFAKRADSLAAMLDGLGPKVTGTPGEAAAAPADVEDAANAQEPIVEIEFSAKAARRARVDAMGDPDVDADCNEADSESGEGPEEEDDDEEDFKPAPLKPEDPEEAAAMQAVMEAAGADSECKKQKQRALLRDKRRRERIPIQRPEGSPAVAPAALHVQVAMEAAGRKREADNDQDADQTPSKAARSTEVSSSSFGPRFEGLSQQEVQQARSKWTLHSLASVRQTSNAENQRAAFDFLEELRQRREGSRQPEEDAQMMEPGAKPVFRPRAQVQRVTIKRPSAGNSRSNGRAEVSADVTGKATVAEMQPQKKRGRISVAMEEDGDDLT
mmetsp:Transcript_17306/g.40293  ORF Transcript_17306/g.40293 Transcript_17306/m.40293 type:complete len:471 (+) Transcript_17306:66-1478(+)